MDLHDFLADSLELLALLETIEQRQGAIVADIARLDALPAGVAVVCSLVARLRAEHLAAEADLHRSIGLLSKF